MTDEQIRESLRGFLAEELFFGEAGAFADGEDLFALGLDSLGVTRLVVFVERRFGIRVPDAEVIAENVRTVDALLALVRRRAG